MLTADASGFRTTYWSVVLAAGHDSSTQGALVLDQLCRAYWYPLCAHVRRRGQDHHAAQYLTQEIVGRGRAAHFEDWKVFLTRAATTADCKASAGRVGMSAGAVAVAVYRLIERYGDLQREAVVHTVPEAAAVDDELRYLFAMLNE